MASASATRLGFGPDGVTASALANRLDFGLDGVLRARQARTGEGFGPNPVVRQREKDGQDFGSVTTGAIGGLRGFPR